VSDAASHPGSNSYSESLVIERLQPSLLDRLISEDPQGPDTYEEQVWSSNKLRAALLRDLEFLLNTSCAHAREPIHQYPHAAHSLLNFGIPSLSGQFAFQREPDALASMIHAAIVAFEPRILRESLSVVADVEESSKTGEAVIEITCEFCPLPMAEALFVRAVLDVENGGIQLKGRDGAPPPTAGGGANG
jgi:type VI secretion system protein ImpF